MEQKAERVVGTDRTEYLQQIDSSGFVWPMIGLGRLDGHGRHGADVGVITWSEEGRGITLHIRQGGFDFSSVLAPQEARLLAQALLMAADDDVQAQAAACESIEVTA